MTPTRLALRLLALLGLCLLALQLALGVRVLAMRWVDPASTTFQRSEALRLVRAVAQPAWSQEWVPYARVSDHLKRAVVASEDAGFTEHHGVEWDAIEKAWGRNQRNQRNQAQPARPGRPPKLVGGSTITQQLAKNLFLSGERTALRKGQEALVTLMLEALLPKQRILEIYLNHVEWGEGLFGAQAAARFYFKKDAARLGRDEAARLAVMLPAPKYFERHPASPYLMQRAATVAARMAAVALP